MARAKCHMHCRMLTPHDVRAKLGEFARKENNKSLLFEAYIDRASVKNASGAINAKE